MNQIESSDETIYYRAYNISRIRFRGNKMGTSEKLICYIWYLLLPDQKNFQFSIGVAFMRFPRNPLGESKKRNVKPKKNPLSPLKGLFFPGAIAATMILWNLIK